MSALFSVLVIIVCVLLILVVLIQNSKGGGIQSQFGAATQIMGVKKGTEVIEKATWVLAILLIVLSVFMSSTTSLTGPSSENSGSISKGKAQNAVTAPAAQQQAPQVPGANQNPLQPK